MVEKRLKKNTGSFIFLGLVCSVYIIVGFIDFSLATRAFSSSIRLLTMILPILILVFALMFVSNIVLKPSMVVRQLGKEAGLRGWSISILGGILSTGPIYVWYPFLLDLKNKGMRPAFIATFLYNRAIKIPLIPVMIYYFGLPFFAVLTCYMILFSVFNGMVVERIVEKRYRRGWCL